MADEPRAYVTPAWPKPGALVRPVQRGKHHVLAAAYRNGRWVGRTACGRRVDRSTWEGQARIRWAPEDGCRACGFTSPRDETPASGRDLPNDR